MLRNHNRKVEKFKYTIDPSKNEKAKWIINYDIYFPMWYATVHLLCKHPQILYFFRIELWRSLYPFLFQVNVLPTGLYVLCMMKTDILFGFFFPVIIKPWSATGTLPRFLHRWMPRHRKDLTPLSNWRCPCKKGVNLQRLTFPNIYLFKNYPTKFQSD